MERGALFPAMNTPKTEVCMRLHRDAITISCSNVLSNMSPKICTKCGKEFPATTEFFFKDKRTKDGLQYFCKKCAYKRKQEWRKENRESARKTHLKHRYGITIEDYKELYNNQNGMCKICGTRYDILYIDHNHKNDKVRGLLCSNCNAGLGMFKENKLILIKALNYLK